MCSGCKSVVKHHYVLINELFTKMSSDFVIVLLCHNVTTTFRYIHVSADSQEILHSYFKLALISLYPSVCMF